MLDLETTDDETDDEDFYDEHPQKLAIQIFNEKRQPLFQPQLNPVNGKHIVCANNSYPYNKLYIIIRTFKLLFVSFRNAIHEHYKSTGNTI